jgi:hypothetical protein
MQASNLPEKFSSRSQYGGCFALVMKNKFYMKSLLFDSIQHKNQILPVPGGP